MSDTSQINGYTVQQQRASNQAQQATPQPTSDQRDLMAAHGTLSAILVAADIVPSENREAVLMGGIEAVIMNLEQRLQFRSSSADILRGAAHLADGKVL